jgi:hypothetical protein
MQILLTWLNKGPKVEESEIRGTKSKFFILQRLKPKFANITGTKSSINPKIN